MYIGNTPADKYQTLQKQSFTTSATDTYILDYAVTNPQDLALFINNVRQNPNDAYTVSGTTLTLSSAITGSDTMYAVFLGRAVETVAPALSSVTNDMLAGSIANAKLANSSITLNGSAVSLGGSATVGGNNTPAFTAILDSNQTMSPNTTTKLTFTSELLDTDNAFADSKFTVPSGKDGNYLFNAKFRASNFSQTLNIYIYKNGSELNTAFRGNALSSGTVPYGAVYLTALVPLVAGDYIEIYGDHNSGSTQSLTTKVFQGFKLL
jgi:hypothetical protein